MSLLEFERRSLKLRFFCLLIFLPFSCLRPKAALRVSWSFYIEWCRIEGTPVGLVKTRPTLPDYYFFFVFFFHVSHTARSFPSGNSKPGNNAVL